MEIAGTVVSLLPLQTGQGKNGVWKKQELNLENQFGSEKKMIQLYLGYQATHSVSKLVLEFFLNHI